jgi:hypothetical protein
MPPNTLPEPSFATIAGGGFVDRVVAFLGRVPHIFDSLGDSPGYLSWIYFLWAVTVIVAGLVIYLAMRLHDLEHKEKEGFYHGTEHDEHAHAAPAHHAPARQSKEEVKKKTQAWHKVVMALKSSNVADWKIAVLEADTILDELFRDLHYPGDNLGERLKNVPRGAIGTLEDAWSAHKLRNRIAHEGPGFYMTKTEFVDALAQFERVFREFNYI